MGVGIYPVGEPAPVVPAQWPKQTSLIGLAARALLSPESGFDGIKG